MEEGSERRLAEALQIIADQRAQLETANGVLEDQRSQMRLLIDAYASQTHWAREWRLQCHENLRLQEMLKARQDGTELIDLKRQIIDKTVVIATLRNAHHQRGILLSNALNEIRMLAAENKRLREKAS